MLGALDSIAYKIHSRVFGITDFVYGGIGRSLGKAFKALTYIVRSRTFESLMVFVGVPFVLFFIIPDIIKTIIKDPIGVAKGLAGGLTFAASFFALRRGLSKDSHRRMKLFVRRLKNRYLPWYLRPGLWRAQQLMQELASTQFNHMGDRLTREIATQTGIAATYACYQRQQDGWVDLATLPAHEKSDKHYADFSKAVAQVCPRYKGQLEQITQAKPMESTAARPVFAQPEGDVLDPHSLAGYIIDPLKEPVYTGVKTEIKKTNRLTVTLALSPAVFEMRAMPEIYALCAALDKKGYDTEVIALFVEAKKPFTSGYGRAQPLKSVHIKKTSTTLRRAMAAFSYAHNVIMPQNHVTGESALSAMNHARTRYGEEAIGLYIGDESQGSRHRTFRGRIRKVSKVLEVHDFDRKAVRKIGEAVRDKKSYFDVVSFTRRGMLSSLDAHHLGHRVIEKLKPMMDSHPVLAAKPAKKTSRSARIAAAP